MKPETKKALHAALETLAFEKVRAALMAEAKFAETACEEHRSRRHLSGLSSAVSAKDWWDNDRWQEAWEKAMPRFGMGLGPMNGRRWAAFTNENGPYFCCPPDFLSGDELADALRDWALDLEVVE